MKKRNIVALLSLISLSPLTISSTFPVSEKSEENNTMNKNHPDFKRVFLKFKETISILPFKYYDNDSILTDQPKIISPKYEIKENEIRITNRTSLQPNKPTYEVDLGAYESDYSLDVLFYRKYDIITNDDNFTLTRFETKTNKNGAQEEISKEEKIILSSLPEVIFNKEKLESRYRLNLSSSLDEKESKELKEELENKKKEVVKLNHEIIKLTNSARKSVNSNRKEKIKERDKKVKELNAKKIELSNLENNIYSNKPRVFILKTPILDEVTNTTFVFKQTFKLNNNSFNVNSTFKENEKGSYFEKQTLWFDTSRFSTPFPENMNFILEPKANEEHKNIGFFVESVFSDQFYIPSLDFKQNELFLYDLTKLTRNHVGGYDWPKAEFYSQDQLESFFNSGAYSGALKNLILYGVRNKKTQLTKWILVQLLPPFTTEKDLENDFWTKVDYKPIIEKNNEEIKKLEKLKTDDNKSDETKKRIEHQITILKQKNKKLEKNLDFIDLLSPYLEYISTNESSKKKLKDIASLLSNSLFRFNDPIINSSHSKINHPKSSFFQFLSKTKGIPSNDIAFLNYPDVYSLFAEYLTFLANDWTSYSSLKILKFDFDFDKLARSITNQNDLEKYKSNHLDFFNDFISLTSNKEKIKSELIKDYIESLELSFNEKLSHLTIKIKSKENAKNEYQFNQIEYILDLKNKKDITLDFLKPKIELNLQTIKNDIKNLSAFRFIDYITKYPNWIINESSKYINSSFLTGDPNLDKFLRGELKEAKITYDLDTFYSSNAKTLKFNIKSINYDFGTFIIDDLIFLGDLFENIKSDYQVDNKSIIEINLFNEINLKKDYISESLSLSSLKEIITNKLTTFLKEKGFNYEDYKNNIDSVITEEITTKLISDQSSIKKKQQDFVEISLSLDSSSLDKKDLPSNKLYFRFTNIKPFDFKDLKLSDVVLNINTIFSEAYTDFEYEVRYKNLIKQLKEEISTNLLNQFKENNNNIGNNYLPEDFISNKKNEGYIFNFKFIPYYLKTKEIELLNKDYDERNEILNKHLEDLFYGLRKINLGITIPSYLKQYYLNSDNFNITVRNHSYLVKLVDFSNIKNEIDKSLEIKYPNWKKELNNKYKSTFKDLATKLGISEDKINLTEAFLNPPKIEIIEAFKNNESILTGEINKKVTLLINKLKNKVFDNNQFLVALAKEILEIYGSYINNFIKQKITEYTKIINPAYNEIFFDIDQFVSPKTNYSFSYNKLFNFLIQDVDFSKVKSIDSLIKNEIEHITKKINIIPSLDADGKPKYGFNDFETSLNISINKNILFEIQWMKYIIDLDKRTQGYFMLPESLKNNLYKEYSLDSKNDEEYLPSPPEENQGDFNNKEPKKPSNTNGSKLKGFNIKEHLVWIIPLALILPLGSILLPILIIRLKKTKKSFLSENADNLNNKNNLKEEDNPDNKETNGEEVISS